MHVHRYVCIYIHTFYISILNIICIRRYIYIYAKTYTSITINIYVCACIHINMCVYIYIYVCNFTCPLLCFRSLHKKRASAPLKVGKDSQRLKRPARHGLGWAFPRIDRISMGHPQHQQK